MFDKIIKFYFAIGQFFIKLFKRFVSVAKFVFRWAVTLLIPILIFWYVVGTIHSAMEVSDDDPSRGVASIDGDPIDKDVDKDNISYLSQNWSASDSLWFYRTSQGSNLLPYDFFLSLEQTDSKELFRDNKNINKYRYLPQVATKSNPDALPVGMAKDKYAGKEYLGFTCAACHTSQINYFDKKQEVAKAIRIDGGPAAADLELFLVEMANALEATQQDPQKLNRFSEAVLKRDAYKNAQQVEDDLREYALRIRSYTQVNNPEWTEGGESGVTHYGFSRLDAFGRIYNRVIQYIVSADELKSVFVKYVPPAVWEKASGDLQAIYDGKDKTNLMLRSLEVLDQHAKSVEPKEWDRILKNIRTDIYNPADAPASYPYLWDIPQHDYVQWTGLVSNGGIGPLGRNVGQVIGVFGTLDWQMKSGWSISAWLGGQSFKGKHVYFKSSIDQRNLIRVEGWLSRLQSPVWPQEIFGALDSGKIAKGEKIFNQRCASCHENIVRNDPGRRIITRITKLDEIGTDPVLAKNATTYTADSGLIKHQYVDTNIGPMVIEDKHPVASLVKFATKNVVTTTDPDKWPIQSLAEWLWDLLKADRHNSVKESARRGDHDAATPEDPFKFLNAYKSRALNGIWATAPYLHNGSVPNLYELMLPKKKEGDPEFDEAGNPIEYRSEVFYVGSREFDNINVGFRKAGYEDTGFKFDTNIRGNSNAGHEYASRPMVAVDGKTIPPLNKAQRLELLEYLKSL